MDQVDPKSITAQIVKPGAPVHPELSAHQAMMGMYPPQQQPISVVPTMRKDDVGKATGKKKKAEPNNMNQLFQQQQHHEQMMKQRQLEQQLLHLSQQHPHQQAMLFKNQVDPHSMHQLEQLQAQQMHAQQQAQLQHAHLQAQLHAQQLAQQQQAHQQAQLQQQQALQQAFQAQNAIPVEPSVFVVNSAKPVQASPVAAVGSPSTENSVAPPPVATEQALQTAVIQAQLNVSPANDAITANNTPVSETAAPASTPSVSPVAINVPDALPANSAGVRKLYRQRKPDEYAFLRSIFELVDLQCGTDERVTQYELAIQEADKTLSKIDWEMIPVLNSVDHLCAIEECSVLISEFLDSMFYGKISENEKVMIIEQSLQLLANILKREMSKLTEKQHYQDDLIWVWNEIRDTLEKEHERLCKRTLEVQQQQSQLQQQLQQQQAPQQALTAPPPQQTQQPQQVVAQPKASPSKPSLPPKPTKAVKPTNV